MTRRKVIKEQNILELYSYTKNTIYNLSKIKPIIIESEPPKKIFNLDEAIILANDFYKNNTPKYIYDAFIKSLYKTKYIIKKQNYNLLGVYNSQKFYKKASITLYSTNTFFDIPVFIHEFAHSIEHTLIPNYDYICCYMFSEVFAEFITMLALDYYQNEFSDVILCAKKNINIGLINAEDIKIKFKILENYDPDQKLLSLEKTYLKFNTHEYLKNTISFITAINLLKKYYIDPEYVFFIINHLNQSKNNEEELFKLFQNNNLLDIHSVKEYKEILIRIK